MHALRLLFSTCLVAAFALGALAEGHHQCATQRPSAQQAADHTDHVPAGDSHGAPCECVGHCCTVAPMAWKPDQAAAAAPQKISLSPLGPVSAHNTPTPVPHHLPFALAPPLQS
jgi:hypothetical protein